MPRITVLKRCILYTVESSEISHFLQRSLTILEVLAILFSTSDSTSSGGRENEGGILQGLQSGGVW